MAVRILAAGERQAAAWKNGGGVTREVAAYPPGAGLADFAWRVSFAEVAEGGPFSVFEGVDRIITLVAGRGMELVVDAVATELAQPFEPFAFRGDAVVGCRLLDGPITDFNVMARRGEVGAAVEIVTGRRVLTAELGTTALVVALGGAATIAWQDAEPVKIALERYDAVALTDGASATIEPGSAVALVTLTTLNEKG